MTTTDKGVTRLLACPFCGSDAEVYEYRDETRAGGSHELATFYRPQCSNYDCIVNTVGSADEDRDDAIAAWNRRALTMSGEQAEKAASEAAEKILDYIVIVDDAAGDDVRSIILSAIKQAKGRE